MTEKPKDVLVYGYLNTGKTLKTRILITTSKVAQILSKNLRMFKSNIKKTAPVFQKLNLPLSNHVIQKFNRMRITVQASARNMQIQYLKFGIKKSSTRTLSQRK
jgi:AAA+ superfamily predicted ATPase